MTYEEILRGLDDALGVCRALGRSLQDYVLLFLWGVGADQGKNLVQLLKS
jgi:hypothetical protein